MGIILMMLSVTVVISNSTTVIHPYQVEGAILLLIAFVTFVIGFALPEKKATTSKEQTEEACGKCALFKTADCTQNSVDTNASECPDYRPLEK